MKIDIDSIFYIVLMIILLVVSGLGSRRKKKAQKMNKPLPSSAQAGTQDPVDLTFPKSRAPVIDPFEKLEQILTGQPRYESMEGESLETLEDEEQMIIDKKSAYLDTPVPKQQEKEPDLIEQTEDEKEEKNIDGLFQDVNEVTRAIIYSEILPRKYL